MAKVTTSNRALVAAIESYGSVEGLAHEMRVTESAIRLWISKDRVPGPAARLMAVLTYSDPHHPKVDALERRLRGK